MNNKQEFEHLKGELIKHHRRLIGNDGTADPVFVVKYKSVDWGYEEEYSEVTHIYYDCETYKSVEDFLFGYDDEDLQEYFKEVDNFSIDELRNKDVYDFIDYLKEHEIEDLDEVYLVHGNYKWKTHNMFLTRESAEEYVEARCGGMDNPNVNIWVDSWYRNYEMKSLLKAIMDGSLVWNGENNIEFN